MTLKYLSLEAYIKWKQNKLVHKSLECWLLEVVEHFIKTTKPLTNVEKDFKAFIFVFSLKSLNLL